MRRKRKKKIGISLLLSVIVIVPQTQAAKKKAEAEPSAVIAGTVFRDPGFALPNATVTLLPNSVESAAPGKAKKLQTTSNFRGEFVFRVPPSAMRYTVKASAKGFQDEEKAVEVQGETRVEVTLSLHQESK